MRVLIIGASGSSLVCAQERRVSFGRDIQPIFEKSCWNCHGSAVLASREAALKVVVPGDAQKSRLYRLVAGLEMPAMPMTGKMSAQPNTMFWVPSALAVVKGVPRLVCHKAAPALSASYA